MHDLSQMALNKNVDVAIHLRQFDAVENEMPALARVNLCETVTYRDLGQARQEYQQLHRHQASRHREQLQHKPDLVIVAELVQRINDDDQPQRQRIAGTELLQRTENELLPLVAERMLNDVGLGTQGGADGLIEQRPPACQLHRDAYDKPARRFELAFTAGEEEPGAQAPVVKAHAR